MVSDLKVDRQRFLLLLARFDKFLPFNVELFQTAHFADWFFANEKFELYVLGTLVFTLNEVVKTDNFLGFGVLSAELLIEQLMDSHAHIT